jgi:hypothetical protein
VSFAEERGTHSLWHFILVWRGTVLAGLSTPVQRVLL